MRQFASSGLRIWNLSLEARLVYSAFGVMSLLAIGSSLLLYEDLVGGTAEGVAVYYAGATAAAPASPRGGGGPEIALPDEPALAASPITVAVSYRKLLEVTHFHLFTVPVFLLVIAHLFMLTGLGTRAKVIWIAAAWGSALLHLAAPWLVRSLGRGYAWSYGVSGAGFGVTATVLTAYPIFAMWFGRPRHERAA